MWVILRIQTSVPTSATKIAVRISQSFQLGPADSPACSNIYAPETALGLLSPERTYHDLHLKSFHEKAGMSQVCFSLSVFSFLPVDSLHSSRTASVAILPSALFVERFSLGAWWAFPIQEVLQPDYRPRLPS